MRRRRAGRVLFHQQFEGSSGGRRADGGVGSEDGEPGSLGGMLG